MKLIIILLLLSSCSFNKIKLKRADEIKSDFTYLEKDLSNQAKLRPLFSFNYVINQNPILIDDHLVYNTKRGKMFIFNLTEKRDISSYKMSFGSNISPVANEKYLVNLTGKGFDNVYVYDFEKKVLAWKEALGNGFESDPVLIDSDLFAASTKGILYKVDLNNFKTKEQVKFKNSVRVDLVNDATTIYIIDEGQNIYALNKSDFSRKWKLKLEMGSFTVKPIIDGEYLYCFSDKGVIFKINRLNGNIVWLRQFGKAFRSAANKVGNEIYIGNVDGYVYQIDENGDLINKYNCKSIVGTRVVVGPEKIYVGSGKGEFLIFNKNSTELIWKHAFKGRFIANPVIWENQIILFTDYDDTYILSDNKE